jgi:hypothetical protein
MARALSSQGVLLIAKAADLAPRGPEYLPSDASRVAQLLHQTKVWREITRGTRKPVIFAATVKWSLARPARETSLYRAVAPAVRFPERATRTRKRFPRRAVKKDRPHDDILRLADNSVGTVDREYSPLFASEDTSMRTVVGASIIAVAVAFCKKTSACTPGCVNQRQH